MLSHPDPAQLPSASAPLQLPPSPRPPAPAQAAESGPGAGPASSQKHLPHLAGACCAGELGRETSGPAECFPGRTARAPCAVASPWAVPRSQPAAVPPSSSPPWKLFIIPGKPALMLRDIFGYKGKINSLSLGGPDALQTPVLKPGPASAAARGQHRRAGGSPGEGLQAPPITRRQHHARGCRPHAARSPLGCRGGFSLPATLRPGPPWGHADAPPHTPRHGQHR